MKVHQEPNKCKEKGITMSKYLEKQTEFLESKILNLQEDGTEMPQFIELHHEPLPEVTGEVETPAQKMMKGAKAVKTLRLPLTTTKEKAQLLSLSINSNATRAKALRSASNAPESRTSIDLSSANEISANTVYQLGSFTADSQLLVKLSTQGIRKLSSVIQFDAAAVVETLIFTVDASNNATVIANSVNMINNFDIVSFLPNGDVYYVLYTVYAGGGNAAIYLPSSASCSASEPNDSPFQVPLRHEECYLDDTFDNGYDTDVMRVQLTKADPVAISLTFDDKDLTGQITLGIYHKADENGNAVDRWLVNTTVDVPTFGLTWNNASAKGEFYIYVQYISGNIINQPYTFSFIPLSKLQVPEWITTGQNGITGVQYGHKFGYPWVMSSFKVLPNFSETASHLTLTETGEYPRIPFKILLVGKDKNGNKDYKNNSFFSKPVHSNWYGGSTVTALLPGVWGNDGNFGDIYERKYDKNFVEFWFLFYDTKDTSSNKKFSLAKYPQVYVTFEEFLNVEP